MATPAILKGDEVLFLYSSIFDPIPKDGSAKSRGSMIEKKIELLENLTSRVSNRRTCRLLNDRLLMELVPCLNAEEIRGLFAPPPWGDEVPVSAFCMTNMADWDKFRSIDMDKEASIMKATKFSSKRKGSADGGKMAILTAWHRVDSRTREALRRSFLSELVEGYEKSVRTFIQEGGDADVLLLQVQDPFHRLLLHGVCELLKTFFGLELPRQGFYSCWLELFYNLVSVTETTKGSETVTMVRIRKKKSGAQVLPSITLLHFLKMAKEGIW